MLPKNKKIKVALIAVFILSGVVLGIFQMYPSDAPVETKPNSEEIVVGTDSLTPQELTIVSFNVRDVKGTKRTLEDFQEIARMIGGADIIVFQELGAKGFKKSGKNKAMLDRFDAMAAAYVAYLGDEWEFVFAPEATPIEMGMGAELPCVAYRKTRGKLSINVDWKEYYDLGDRRDMGMFDVSCKQGSVEEKFVIGSVHTKPDAPGRIEEINRIADYIDENVDSKFILMGDMNWGYKTSKNKFPDRYNAEERIVQQHADGKVLQVFNSISYTGKGSEDDFRTNLDIRKVGQMYDQFLVCKAYSSKMARGNKLDEDCGFYSFSEEDYFQDAVDDEVNNLVKGYKVYLKRQGLKMSSKEAKAKIKEMEEYIITNTPPNEGPTHRLSDHKPIWMQLKLF
ncbi:MAG: endonuclease/exonuclease/phosphatase family metal-dependent hydrolase [Crocinitomicaceae bacterium]|jgi:endonuclease/exonuclease/phosphatase family metal-dependent hydrolase